MKAQIVKTLLIASLAGLLATGIAADRYFVTKNGTKYHLKKSCSGLKNAKAIAEVSMNSIRKKRITLCEICKAKAKKTGNG